MNTTSWSTQQLAAFLAIFEEHGEDEVIVAALDRAAEALDAEVAAVIDGQGVQRYIGFAPGHAPVESLLELSASTRSRAVIGSLGEVHSFVAPVGRSGLNLLVLRVGSPLDREEETLLRSMGKALAIAIATNAAFEREQQTRAESERVAAQNQELADQLSQRHAFAEQLVRIQQSISHRAPLQEILDTIAAGAADLLGVDVVAIRLPSLDDSEVHHTSLIGYEESVRESYARVPLDDGFAGIAFREDRLVRSDERLYRIPDARRHLTEHLNVAMAAPIHREDEPFGVMTVASSEAGRQFTKADQEVLLALAEHASVAVNDASTLTELRRSLEITTRQARHDSLTGLLNRSGVLDTLDIALAQAAVHPVMVFFVDVDRFKSINDEHGHAAGDAVLRELARRLQESVRDGDVVGRLSGDEFVVITRPIDLTIGSRMAARLVAAAQEPIIVGDREIAATVSVGVATAIEPTTTAANLLADADVAMYRAKQAGRSRVVHFDRRMRSELRERSELERQIAAGIGRGEFCLYFQPCVDVRDRSLRGVEALVRWNHPTRGLLGPEHFIRIAEETGLIGDLDAWVLEESCRQLGEWQSRGLPEGFHVSVNVSAIRFADPTVATSAAHAIRRHGVPTSALWLELTETAAMEESATNLATMNALRELGVRFMIDDFGTGYSSLVYLKRFPIDTLKVDRVFTDGLGQDTEDEAIVSAILGVASGLGLGVIAEGVETEEQRLWLQERGCNLAQGFLFSRPLPAVEMTALIRSGNSLTTGSATGRLAV